MSGEFIGLTFFFATTLLFMVITILATTRLSRIQRELDQLRGKLHQGKPGRKLEEKQMVSRELRGRLLLLWIGFIDSLISSLLSFSEYLSKKQRAWLLRCKELTKSSTEKRGRIDGTTNIK